MKITIRTLLIIFSFPHFAHATHTELTIRNIEDLEIEFHHTTAHTVQVETNLMYCVAFPGALRSISKGRGRHHLSGDALYHQTKQKDYIAQRLYTTQLSEGLNCDEECVDGHGYTHTQTYPPLIQYTKQAFCDWKAYEPSEVKINLLRINYSVTLTHTITNIETIHTMGIWGSRNRDPSSKSIPIGAFIDMDGITVKRKIPSLFSLAAQSLNSSLEKAPCAFISKKNLISNLPVEIRKHLDLKLTLKDRFQYVKNHFWRFLAFEKEPEAIEMEKIRPG